MLNDEKLGEQKLVGALDMRCGSCPIIDACNDYEETPPCKQVRFKAVPCDVFLAFIQQTLSLDGMQQEAVYEAVEEALAQQGYYDEA